MIYNITEYNELKEYINSGEIKEIDKDSVLKEIKVNEYNLYDVDGDDILEQINVCFQDGKYFDLNINGKSYSNEMNMFFEFETDSYYRLKTYKYIYDNTNNEINEKRTVYSIAFKEKDDSEDRYIVFQYENGVLNYATTIIGDIEEFDYYDYGFMINKSKACYLLDNLPESLDEKNNVIQSYLSIEGSVDFYSGEYKYADKENINCRDLEDGKIICYIKAFAGAGWLQVENYQGIYDDIENQSRWIYVSDIKDNISVIK